MKKIAFVTASTKPLLSEDDSLVVPFLASRGVQVEPQPWDDPTVDWKQYRAVVLRSCWNYHHHPEAFANWIDQLEAEKVRIFNPPAIVKWNIHKTYLKDLAVKGIAMAKTVWLAKGSSVSLRELINEFGQTRLVIKPTIAAGAYQTFLIDPINADEQAINDLLKTHDLIVQEFIPEVQTEGEWSLLFFGGEFSHAVLKKPKTEDFRVQHEFGGIYSQSEPPSAILAQAKKILESVQIPLLYARVDGVVSKGTFLLMELELIEPALFLGSHPKAADLFAARLLDI